LPQREAVEVNHHSYIECAPPIVFYTSALVSIRPISRTLFKQ
jgi:hypothetical protein